MYKRQPGAQFDMVRLGIGLYGVDPFTNKIIHNVSTLKTTILQIHDVPKEETVGYSRKGHLERDSRIAAIPIGYADGLNRKLGNGNAYCLVNGQKAPYVGNICMDVCMIDVTDIDCKEGDKAVIFGDDLPVTVLAEILGTIPYEILTSVSNRVKRVYSVSYTHLDVYKRQVVNRVKQPTVPKYQWNSVFSINRLNFPFRKNRNSRVKLIPDKNMKSVITYSI